AAGVAAKEIVNWCGAVDRDAERGEARLSQGARAFDGERATASLHRDPQAPLGEVSDDRCEVAAEIGLAADEHHLSAAELGEAASDIENFAGRELALACRACARTAVLAGLIAFHRQLPHRVDRFGPIAVLGASHSYGIGHRLTG